jgi:hypothetical protein
MQAAEHPGRFAETAVPPMAFLDQLFIGVHRWFLVLILEMPSLTRP